MTNLSDDALAALAELLLAAADAEAKDLGDDDNGGTECAVARCHAKATDTTWWRGVLMHVCSRHAAGNQQGDEDAI